MSPSLISAPFGSLDRQKLQAGPDSSMLSNTHKSPPLADATLLSSYQYQTYSNSASPSVFSTQAELTSENSNFSDYDYHADDEFFGVDFDAGDQAIDAIPLVLEDVPLPTTELPAVEAYLPQVNGHAHPSSDTLTNSTYPMSSNQSSPLSRHSPNSETHGTPATRMVAHSDHSRNMPTSYATMTFYDPASQEDPPRGHDLDSAGRHMSVDNVAHGMPSHLGHSPRVTVTPAWDGLAEQDQGTDEDHGNTAEYSWIAGLQTLGASSQEMTGNYPVPTPSTATLPLDIPQEGAEAEYQGGSSRRAGFDPERRRSVADVKVANFRDQEEQAQLEVKKLEVEEWRSQAGESTGSETEIPDRSSGMLHTPVAQNRPRARSTGAFPGYFPPDFTPLPQTSNDPEEGRGIDPLDDDGKGRENRLQGGQTYFNLRATTITDEDRKLFMQFRRHWSDAPAYPYVTGGGEKTQPETSNEASKKFNELSDNFSVISRSATWGTRRRSEPSIADLESFKSGGLLKRLSINSRKEKKPGGPGGLFKDYLFKDSLNQLAGIVRKKSDSKPKRPRSGGEGRGLSEAGPAIKQEVQTGLAPPQGPIGRKRGASTSRLNTNVSGPSLAASSSGSASATAAAAKPSLGLMGVIRRARSRSDLQQEKPGLAKLWREQGGPPLPTLASPPLEEAAKLSEYSNPVEYGQEPEFTKPEFSDAEGEEDEEDEPADDGELEDFDQSTPITPNLAGFREHVLRLHPMMEQNYLVERIAHQQVVRYKTLLGWRVKHSAAIANNSCAARSHCIALGGSATLLESKTQPRDQDPNNGLQIMTDLSDGDSNPEGALAAESFPPGVPMPPATSLPAEFECQLCFKVKKFQKPSDWTKHVHEDVQPFTCTYSSCKEPKSFKRKADWVRHENERHRRLGWWTCTVEDCTHKCYRKDNFLQHLVREHKIPEPKQKSKAQAKKDRNSDEPIWVMIRNSHHETTAKPQDEPCKFCGRTLNSWKKLTVHLAKHMEGISLSVLRLVQEREVDGNTIISPVEPLPARTSPLTPVDHDRRPSNGSIQPFNNMNASISPNIPQTIYATQNIARAMDSMGNYPPVMFGAQNNMPALGQFVAVDQTDFNFDPSGAGQESAYRPPQQPGFIYDNNGIPYSSIDQVTNETSRGFSAMDHSPHMDQSGFNAVNTTNYAASLPQQPHNFTSYASSIHTLSPDPAAGVFVSGPAQMPGFQQTHGPVQQGLRPDNQTLYTRSHGPINRHGHGQAFPVQHQGMQPEDSFNTGTGMGFETSSHQDPQQQHRSQPHQQHSQHSQHQQQQHQQHQMAQMMRGRSNQGGVGYPPTTNGGYGYHHPQ